MHTIDSIIALEVWHATLSCRDVSGSRRQQINTQIPRFVADAMINVDSCTQKSATIFSPCTQHAFFLTPALDSERLAESVFPKIVLWFGIK